MGSFPRNTHNPNQCAMNMHRSPAAVLKAQSSWRATLYAPGLASDTFQKVPCLRHFMQQSRSERGTVVTAGPLGLACGIQPPSTALEEL